MKIEELQKRAKKIVAENNWDKLLIEAYLETKNYGVRSKRDDFEEYENIGIKYLSNNKKNFDSYSVEFLIGEIKGIKFEIGGVTSYGMIFEDEERTIYENVFLVINENRAISAVYQREKEAFMSEHFSLSNLVEFHNSDLIDPLLKAFHEGIVEKRRKRDELIEKKQSSKFTF